MWDERYSRPDYVYGTQPNAFLVSSLEYLPANDGSPRHILCLAEGEGRNAVYLAEQGYQITAVDLSQVGLDKAQALALERGVSIETVCADLGEYEPEPQIYDAVILVFCHVPAKARLFLFEQVKKALRPGGLVVVEAYTPKQLGKGTGGPSDASFMYDKQMLDQAFQNFEVLLSQECSREIQEGLFHNGLGEVVQFVARKSF